jgi:hypothetical protein
MIRIKGTKVLNMDPPPPPSAPGGAPIRSGKINEFI